MHCYKATNQRKVVEQFYLFEDEDWHRYVHENGRSAVENIEDTLNSLSAESVMYCLDYEKELAAFFTRFEDEYGNLAMEAFHVGKKFRTKEFLKEFWDSVKTIFGKDFWVGVYVSNVEAINHLDKQGFELDRIDNHRGLQTFIYKVKI